MRFWLDVTNSDYWFPLAFSKFSGAQDHNAYFTALDQLVRDAKSKGIYLVPVLASAYDQWTALGKGESFWKIESRTNIVFKEWAIHKSHGGK